MSDENFLGFENVMSAIFPRERLITDLARRLAYGTDASFYRLIPRMVVKVRSEQEVSKLLQVAQRFQVPITFRAAGTSLSGQAITDSVLVTLDSNWTRSQILDNGEKIALQPGLTGAQANRLLAPHQRKIGPDPASINSAKIGGIAANNASGMCCGTAQNSYQTLESLKLVFADGTTMDTSSAESRENFAKTHGPLLEALRQLHQEVLDNSELTERIRQKYKIKNTTGYHLNALIEFEDPFEILQHLMIGSEGTLGFLSEITYKTVPDYADKASALLIYDDMEVACKAIQLLKSAPIAAAELMDFASLNTMRDKEGVDIDFEDLPQGAAAILIETRAVDQATLQNQIKQTVALLQEIPRRTPCAFTSIPEEYARLWNIRKGLFPTVGTLRKMGTTVIIEDVAFPLEHLASATLELQSMFQKHGYSDAIIFGHAFEGNLHFVFTQDFQESSEVERYQHFMDDVCSMVVERYQGSLKAEHGTGRNMAPFVEMEWGSEAYALMQRIKDIFDPAGILNPDVILSTDPQIHLKHFKPLPKADPLVDKCIECGFCEINCPSKNLTITPRQRIVLWREIARLQNDGSDSRSLKNLQHAFQYYGEETCATDSLCAEACPVDIDTGKLIKKIRASQHSNRQGQVAKWVGQNIGKVSRVAGITLGMANQVHRVLGTSNMEKLTRGARKLSGNRIPQWTAAMPSSTPFNADKFSQKPSERRVVYFPSCMARTMGPAQDSPEALGLPETVIKVLNRAGYEIIFPKTLDNLCCGKAFESKGFEQAAQTKQQELEAVLLQASEQGKYPVLCETSPCLAHMKTTLSSKLELYEPLEFAEAFLIPHLSVVPQQKPMVFHLTCSARKMGLEKTLRKIAALCSENVIFPENVGCCGFAGDRGFHVPELNQSALEELKQQIPDNCQDGYSTSCTCEIGLSEHGKIPYRSIFYLLEQVTREEKPQDWALPKMEAGANG